MKTFILSFSFLFLSSAWAQSAVLPLFCKTSKDMQLGILHRATGSGDFYGIKPSWVFYFKRGQTPLMNNVNNLQPGECTWPDRLVTKEESPCAIYTFPDFNSTVWSLPMTLYINHENKVSGGLALNIETKEFQEFLSINKSEGKVFIAYIARRPYIETQKCYQIISNRGFPYLDIRP